MHVYIRLFWFGILFFPPSTLNSLLVIVVIYHILLAIISFKITQFLVLLGQIV